MHLIVDNTANFSGQVMAPSSKSHAIRAIFLATLAQGKSTLFNVLNARDTQDAIRVCRQLGAEIEMIADSLIIQGINRQKDLRIACQDSHFFSGDSGITTRFLLPLLGLRENSQHAVTLACGEQMRARPIAPLVNALQQLGLSIHYLGVQGFCPVIISGNLQGGVAQLSGTSSQHISALLLALPAAPQDSEIRVKDLCGRPYVEMTMQYLREQQMVFTHTQNKTEDIFYIQGRQKYKALHAVIGGDFSSASYMIAAATLLPGTVELNNLNRHDTQGDKKLIDILQAMGADIVVEPRQLIIRGGKKLTGIKIDARDIPDLLPTLAVIGTQAEGRTEITQVKHARIKETDRIHSMTEGLRKLGARIEEQADGMIVYNSQLKGAEVRGFNDHRTVMALTIAGMLASASTRISDMEAVDKSFPNFMQSMQNLGAKIRMQA